MLQVQNLTKMYGDKTAVNDMSFIVPDGKVTGFWVPMGQVNRPRCACWSDSISPPRAKPL